MRWVIFRRVRNRRGSERGAAAALMAILLAGGLLTFGAVALNVGNWYSEKGQTQNGADGAVLAIAQACAANSADTTTCNSSLSNPAAVKYGTENANDGASAVSMICGNAPNASGTNRLTPCSGSNPCPGCPGGVANLCPPGTGTYVDVQIAKGGGQALLGGVLPSGQDKTIGSCAQANIDAAGGGQGLAITFSLCSWKAATSDGTAFGPQPPYTTWPPAGVAGYTGNPPAPGAPGGEQVLLTHGSGNDCAGNAGSGWQLPGGFGFLNSDGTGTCSATVNVDNTYADNTGNNISDECSTVLDADRTNHTVIYLPIYDGVQGSGSNGIYHLAGFAAFVVTGGFYNGQHGGFKVASNITGNSYCHGSDRCLYGFFTQGLVPAGTGGGSVPGANAVSLSG